MKTGRRIILFALAGWMWAGVTTHCPAATAEKPNIVYILADDQGWGDAACNNTQCGFPTPGIDQLAREGMRFTDAHSGSAVCTPTRYGVLTGRYSWRTRLQLGVLQSGSDPLIAQDTLTVQQLLKENGYQTACIGKWHLGFHYKMPPGKKSIRDKDRQVAVPVGSKIVGGPITRGFDFFRGFHHAGEMRTWIEQDEVTANIPTRQMLPRITKSAITYLHQRAEQKDGPFFLYVPLNAPHGPLVPTKAWQGKSKLNIYADFVMQVDDTVRRIVKALDESGLSKETLVFFTADNGCSPVAKLPQLRKKGHDPMGGLRGHKADAWEGGHRVPFVARWPGVIPPGAVTDEPICLNNLMATCADILGAKLPEDAGVDSFSILPVLKGKAVTTPTHPMMIHHSVSGRFALRRGTWKYLACKGSGGWSKGDDGKPEQLYDLSADLAEQKNLIDSEPEKAREMRKLLKQAVGEGRTTPGPKQRNDVPVTIRKQETP